MSDAEADRTIAEKSDVDDPQRRNLALALLGALGGTAFLESCAGDASSDAEELGQFADALTGTNIRWVDAIGTAPVTGTNLNLRGHNPGASTTTLFAVAFGYANRGDGGGGIFAWSTPATAIDDGGTIIVAGQPLGSTVPGRYWKRIYSGAVDVRWFGAVGNGIVDDRAAIQRAIDFAVSNASSVTWAGNGSSGFAAYSTQVVFLPKGIYALGYNPGQTTYPMDRHGLEVPGPLILQGEAGTILQPTAAVGNTTSLIRIGGSVTVSNIQFVNGANSIALMGPTAKYGSLNPQGTNPIVIDKCRFVTPRSVAIWQDCTPTSDPSFYRSFQHPLFVTNFYFIGPTLFWGTGDYVVFQCGNISWDQTNISPQPSGDGKPLGLINSSAHTILDNCEITPNGSAQDSPPWPARNSLFVGGGTIEMHNVIQFDIGACIARAQLLSNTYQGLADAAVQIPNDGLGPNGLPYDGLDLTLSNSTLNAIGKNLIEVYEVFPRELKISNLTESLIGPSMGMWVHEGVPLATALQQHAINQVIKIAVYRTPGYAHRIRRSSEALSQTLVGAGIVDITSQFEPYFFGMPYEQNVTQVPASPNLFLPGIYNPIQLLSAGGGLGGSGDSLTGYTLQDWTAGNPPLPFSFVSQAWGANMPAGVYCFSMYVLANFSGEWMFGYIYNGQYVNLGARRFHASIRSAGPNPPRDGHYQRLWFSFYFPGGSTSTHQFQGACYPLEPANYMAYGLFAIHQGATPAPYTFPVDVITAPTKNTTTSKILGIYYAAAGPPASGTYAAGDRVILDPPSNGIQEWVCTQGGPPGLWAPVPTGGTSVALGAGATPTLGAIGGSGPTAAAQAKWLKVVDSVGAVFFIPAWQ